MLTIKMREAMESYKGVFSREEELQSIKKKIAEELGLKDKGIIFELGGYSSSKKKNFTVVFDSESKWNYKFKKIS